MGDKYVLKYTEQMGQRRYGLSSLQQIIKASGRIVRSKDEWGDTHILDRTTLRLIQQYRSECSGCFWTG